MTRRQSKNQRIGGIESHHVPKNFECKNPLENFSPRFFGIKTASSSLIIFQRAEISLRSITHLCWCNWRIFWRKKSAAGRSSKGVFSCTTMPRLTGHLQTRRNCPTWAYTVLIIHPILRRPRRNTTYSLDWKNNWMVAIFRPTQRSFLPLRPIFWIFLSALQKLEQRAKKCIEIREVCDE